MLLSCQHITLYWNIRVEVLVDHSSIFQKAILGRHFQNVLTSGAQMWHSWDTATIVLGFAISHNRGGSCHLVRLVTCQYGWDQLEYACRCWVVVVYGMI
jgi:hypothetical protein